MGSYGRFGSRCVRGVGDTGARSSSRKEGAGAHRRRRMPRRDGLVARSCRSSYGSGVDLPNVTEASERCYCWRWVFAPSVIGLQWRKSLNPQAYLRIVAGPGWRALGFDAQKRIRVAMGERYPGWPRRHRRPLHEDSPGWVVHIPLEVAERCDALATAEVMAGLLAQFFSEVDPGGTTVSAADRQSVRHAVFCDRRLDSASIERCGLRAGHTGRCLSVAHELYPGEGPDADAAGQDGLLM
jgi:hypothetical protein